VEINLIGTFNVLRLGAERIAQHDLVGEERGVIINTASVADFDGQIGQAAYSASKGGVVGMTLPIARDLASKGIRVMTIAPACSTPRCWPDCLSRPGSRLASRCRNPSRLGKPRRIRRIGGAHRREPDASTARSSGGTARIRMAPR